MTDRVSGNGSAFQGSPEEEAAVSASSVPGFETSSIWQSGEGESGIVIRGDSPGSAWRCAMAAAESLLGRGRKVWVSAVADTEWIVSSSPFAEDGGPACPANPWDETDGI